MGQGRRKIECLSCGLFSSGIAKNRISHAFSLLLSAILCLFRITIHCTFLFHLKFLFCAIHCCMPKMMEHTNRLSAQSFFSKKNAEACPGETVWGGRPVQRAAVMIVGAFRLQKSPHSGAVSLRKQFAGGGKSRTLVRQGSTYYSQKPRKSLKRCQSPFAGGSSRTVACSFSSSRTF